MHGFYKYLVQKDEYCVLILGLDDAGKTVSKVKNQRRIMKVEFGNPFWFFWYLFCRPTSKRLKVN